MDRSRLAAEMIRQLYALPRLDWLPAYREACMTLGRPVQILAPGQPARTAFAVDVGEQAQLLVRRSDGSLEAINTGEVSVRS